MIARLPSPLRQREAQLGWALMRTVLQLDSIVAMHTEMAEMASTEGVIATGPTTDDPLGSENAVARRRVHLRRMMPTTVTEDPGIGDRPEEETSIPTFQLMAARGLLLVETNVSPRPLETIDFFLFLEMIGLPCLATTDFLLLEMSVFPRPAMIDFHLEMIDDVAVVEMIAGLIESVELAAALQ